MARFTPTRRATFTPTGRATFTPVADEASFSLVSDEATFTVDNPDTPTLADQEETAQRMLEREGIASAEAAFIMGEIHYVISSNVSWFQYLWRHEDGSLANMMYVGFHDGSVYEYEQISFEMALSAYRTGSSGKWVWDNLRERGTVFGFQVPYRLVSGNRIWHQAGPDSQARHEAIPKSGETYKGYHPSMNYADAKGAMGAEGQGVNLNKRGGSRKVSFFTPVKAKTWHAPKPK